MHLNVKILAVVSTLLFVASGCYSPSPEPAVTPPTVPIKAIVDSPQPGPDPEDLDVDTDVISSNPESPQPEIEDRGASTALDPAGQTLPDTNYPIPTGAVFMSPDGSDANPGTMDKPVRSINQAVALSSTNGTIVMRGGEHRTWYSNAEGTSHKILTKSLTIQAYPHEQPWFNGADIIKTWTNNGNGTWSTPWSTPSFCSGQYYTHEPNDQSRNNTGPCSNYDMANSAEYPVSGDPQMIFVDGVNKRQVGSVHQVGPNSFHYDWGKRVLTIGINPIGHSIEAAARPVALILGSSDGHTIRGVGFHRYASNQYSNLTAGAVYVGGNVSTFENVVFAHNAGVGMSMSTPQPGSQISKSVFAFNGSLGLAANGSSKVGGRNDLVIEDSVFSGNNFEYFGEGCRASCGAGNIKLTRMVGFTARNNVIENAHGSTAMGLWCDINCSGGVIVNNVVRGNGKHGIFYEISRDGIIASNLVVNNGDRGLMIGSATTKVYNNTVIIDPSQSPKAQGIVVFDDERWPDNPAETGPNTTGIHLVNNVVAGPSGILMIITDGTGPNNTQAENFFDRFDGNAYHHANGQNFINWKNGNPSIGTYFKSVSAFKTLTTFEQNGIEYNGGPDPFFVDSGRGDYRIRPGGPLDNSGLDIPADVAKAIGVTPGTKVGRGALKWPAMNGSSR